MHYIKTNLNPNGKEVGDCVVRAIQLATKQTWEKVYDDLCQLGKMMYRMPNDKKVYETYLARYRFQKYREPRKLDGSKYTVENLIDHYRPTDEKITIIKTNRHLVTVVGETLKDTWDCRKQYVRQYWS